MIKYKQEEAILLKPELLSPVGNFDMLYQAIHNGADAIYLAGHDYGARKYAQNFSKEELQQAISYAHLYDVKVYVTVNTMIYEEEVPNFLDYISFLEDIQVDALIISDIGMINLVHNTFPNIELHASTQCHIYNEESVLFYKNLGVTRVVLARETSLATLKKLPNNIEKEIFIHGALCLCYSGCCLFSSMTTNRSGNRGSCTAPCRKPYSFIEDDKKIKLKGKYPLSTKDLNTTSKIKEILDTHPACLKIEGRMKSPEYVGYVTKIYRKLIDNYYEGKSLILSPEEEKNLKELYNRGFTTGHLFNDKILNPLLQSNNGISIGKVIETNSKYIKIKLSDNINQEDGIKFFPSDKGLIVNKIYNDKYKLINSSPENTIIYIDNKVNLKPNDTVLKTISKKLNESLGKYNPKKLPLDITLIAKLNNPLSITLKRNNIKVTVTGNEKIELAQKYETTEEDIYKHLVKLGNTPYLPRETIVIKDDNIFIPMSSLNNLRREALTKLINTYHQTHKDKIIKTYHLPSETTKPPISPTINVLIRNEEQLLICINEKVETIYTEDYTLYEKYKNKANIYYKVPRISTTYKELKNENILVSDYGTFNYYKKNNKIVTDYTMNIANNYSAILLDNEGANKITLSVEMSVNQITQIKKSINTEVLIYGTPELMVIKTCLLNEYLNNHTSCKEHKYYLNEQDKYYPIITKNCHTYIYHHKEINNINNISNLLKYGIKNYRIDLLNENESQVKNIINKIRKELKENE
mgnify:FL=1